MLKSPFKVCGIRKSRKILGLLNKGKAEKAISGQGGPFGGEIRIVLRFRHGKIAADWIYLDKKTLITKILYVSLSSQLFFSE